MLMSFIYELKKIKKTYDKYDVKTHALNDINLRLIEGEVIVILGPSGSGKSTLLNVLSGIDNPTSGVISFYDKEISNYSEEDLTEYRKNNLGFIFQSYNLIPNLTVKENIELGSHISNNPLNVDEMMNLVGLREHKNKFPYQLSGGQMQRVSIARALVKNPKVLFCDEPTGALDEHMGKQILKILQDINKKYNTTIIIVTHNPSIKNIANTVITMKSGKIEKKSKNKKVVDAEEIRWA
jgi:putative ABC transport system ATP-binding protein